MGPLSIPSSRPSTPVVAQRDGLCFGDARQQSLAAISWELGVLGRRFPGWQVVTKRSSSLQPNWLNVTPAYRSFIDFQMVLLRYKA
jgi:hypothetical protein